MKNKYLFIVLFALGINAQNYDFTYEAYETTLQQQPVSTQQYITFGASVVGSAVVSTWLEEQTKSRFVGILGGIAVSTLAGILVDDNDQRSLPSYTLKNTPQAYNDTVAGALGGVVGSVAINIPLFTGRGNSKRGFNGRYKSRKFKR